MTSGNVNIPPQMPIDPQETVTPAGDHEIVYFSGSPMLRGELMFTTFWILVGIAVAVAPFLVRYFRPQTYIPWWVYLIALAVGAIVVLIPVLTMKRTRYRISNYRIDREIGLLSKRIETMELWHVEDIQFFQSLGDRLLGVGTITVLSHDDTTPRLELKSLPKPRPLFDQLKNRVIAVKRQRGVIKLDAGGISDAVQG
jgi:membrane protein YdbS with pleckstrin-like domain